MKKHLLRFILLISVILGINTAVAFADTYETIGVVTYRVTSYKAHVYQCDSDASGTVGITSRLYASGVGWVDVVGIDENAFAWVENVTSISIPSTVTSIEDYAFWNCDSLKTITVNSANPSFSSQNGVLYDKNKTTIIKFPENSDIKDFTIPSSVTDIKIDAFNNCKLTKITINENLSSLKYSGLFGCAYLTDFVVSDKNTVFSSADGILYNKDKTELIFYPYPKTDSSFIVPDSVTTIGSGAFSGNISLTSIIIGDNVEKIGSGAFSGCKNISSITFSDKVTSISSGAFSGCKALKLVNLPENVKTISSEMFSGCSSLETVNFGKNVTTIGEKAFEKCISLKTFTVPDSVKTLGNSAFFECTGLTSVTLPEDLEIIEISAFRSCSSLKDIVIPQSVKQIKAQAFYNCTALNNINLPNNLESVGGNAFYGCDLSDTAIPDSIIRLAKNSFNNCEVKFNTSGDITYLPSLSNPYFAVYSASTSLKSATINKNTKVITDNAFYNCTKLTTVSIPEGVSSIGAYSFYQCSTLKGIDIPESAVEIGEYAFYGCVALTDVEFGSNLETIGNYAFYNCSKINGHITIPDKVKTLGDYSFYKCKGLTEVTLGKSVTKIGKNTFAYCSYLKNVEMPDSLETIEYAAFDFCVALESIEIPDNVTKIAGDAFYYCTGLKRIVFGKCTPTISDWAFFNCTGLEGIYISDLEAWCNINFVAAKSNPASVADGNLYLNNELITDLKIPDGITKIGTFAFAYFKDLKSVTIPESVETIDYYAFGNCTGLTDIVIGRGVKEIGQSAFVNCNNLETVYYEGDEASWNNIKKQSLNNANIVYLKYVTVIDENRKLITDGYFESGKPIDFSELEFEKFGYNPVLYTDAAHTVKYNTQSVLNENTTLYVVYNKIYTETQKNGNTFYISAYNIENGSLVILGLYKGDVLVDIQNAEFKGDTLSFSTTADYDAAKVMLWKNLSDLKPLTEIQSVE